MVYDAFMWAYKHKTLRFSYIIQNSLSRDFKPYVYIKSWAWCIEYLKSMSEEQY